MLNSVFEGKKRNLFTLSTQMQVEENRSSDEEDNNNTSDKFNLKRRRRLFPKRQIESKGSFSPAADRKPTVLEQPSRVWQSSLTLMGKDPKGTFSKDKLS